MEEEKQLRLDNNLASSSQHEFTRKYQYLTAIIICLNGMINGSSIAWSSVSGLSMEKHLGPTQTSWTIACFPIAAMISSLPAGKIAQRFGPKTTLQIFATIPSILGWIIIISSIHYAWIGRFFLGIASGIITVVVPVYCEEVTLDIKVRGRTGVFFDLMMGTGILWPNLISLITVKINEIINNNNKTSSYQIINDGELLCVNISCAFLVSMIGIVLIFIPESPMYLISKGKENKVKKILAQLKAPHLSQLQLNNQELNCIVSWKARIIVLCLIIVQQLSGIDVILFYMETLFVTSGMDKLDGFGPREATVVSSVIQVFSSIVASLTVDHVGRRILLIISEILMILSFILLSIHAKGWIDLAWLPTVAITLFLIGFTIGIGPLPWLLMAELIPGGGWLTGIFVMIHWLLEMILTSISPFLFSSLGPSIYYAILGFSCFLGLLFVLYTIPETKGLKRSEIQKVINSCKFFSFSNRKNIYLKNNDDFN